MRKWVRTGCMGLICSCMVIMSTAQTRSGRSWGREFTFTTENDAYLLQKKDAYYTNGFSFNLRTAKEIKGKRVISSYELGQKIYTPLIRKTTGPKDIDRPYCGYLYLQFMQTRFPANDAILQYEATLGQVGQASLGENLQNSYHKMLGYARFTGWQYQVQNSLGTDIGARYAQTLLQDSSLFKFIPVAELSLGMNYTYAALGAYFCLGAFEKNQQSALWNARLQTGEGGGRKAELFAYWYPQIIFQGYNVTVQGGLISKGQGAVLKDPEPLMFLQHIGLCYASGRITTNLALVIQSKETTTQTNPHQYGSVQVSYRFH
jgi:lipid A 3-O-deacylase